MRTLLALVAAGACTALVLADQPISPGNMTQMLKRGFDVRWAEFNADIEAYTSEKPKLTAQAGFANARVRVDFDLTDESFAKHLDRVLNDTLQAGLIPVLAKKGETFKDDPSKANMDAYVAWWAAASQRYQSWPHRLVFDLMVEPAKALGKLPTTLNEAYARATGEIRKTNPTRVLAFAPAHIASADYLKDLVVPQEALPYAIAEWHDFAAGPSPDPSSKKYWTGNGTAAQRAAFEAVADTAVRWSKGRSGVPLWFGAWMSDDFNHGSHFSVQQQCAFAQFICETMANRSIPWSINTFAIYYGEGSQPAPVRELQPVLDVLKLCADP